jgi:hypothetical protein
MAAVRPNRPERPQAQRVTTEQIIAAYRETGSVWKAAKCLGINGQSVHERLVAIEYPMLSRNWTKDEVLELRALIQELVPLGEIARRLGRPYAGVACKASELGIRSLPRRTKKVPRGAGYDKASMTKHVAALWKFDGTITQYARAHTLNIESFVRAFQRHFPEAWNEYAQAKSPGPRETCPYCEDDFFPTNGKQQYCSRKCSDDARRDRQYFGGNRRLTVGLRAGICQLCGGERTKGLSSHHVLGKEHDPDNRVLIALCRGCHRLVGDLAGRKFVEDEGAWQSLITLVWMRRKGAELRYGEAISVLVELEVERNVYEIDEFDEIILSDGSPVPTVADQHASDQAVLIEGGCY